MVGFGIRCDRPLHDNAFLDVVLSGGYHASVDQITLLGFYVVPLLNIHIVYLGYAKLVLHLGFLPDWDVTVRRDWFIINRGSLVPKGCR